MWTFYAPSVDPTMGTSLPASPVDGQEFTLVDSMSAPTYAWRLRYVSAKASNKWMYVGGSPIIAEVATGETTASTAYAALATAGPSIALPVAGDYWVAVGANIEQATTTYNYMSYDIGGTGAVDADAFETRSGAGNLNIAGSFERKKSGLTAVTLTAKYRVAAANTATFKKRWMRVIPIALGG